MTKNWKSLVVLSLVAISSSAARAGDDVKEFVHENPGITGAMVGTSVIGASVAARYGANQVLDRTPMPGYSNGDMNRVASDAAQRFRDEGERLTRQSVRLRESLKVEEKKYQTLLERPTSHATQEETIAVSHAQDVTVRPGFFHPHVTEHVSDASSDVVNTTNGVSKAAIEQHKKIEAIKFKLAEIESKSNIVSKKQAEVMGYLHNGSKGYYLTAKDRKELDAFKPRFEIARKEGARLGAAVAEVDAKRELVRKVSNTVNWAGVAAWPVIGLGISMNDARIENERRQKEYQEQVAAEQAASAAKAASGAAK